MKKRGVTLLETIIYIGLLSAVLVGIMMTVYPLFRGAEQNTQTITAEGEAAFVFRKIAWALSDYTDSSALGISGGTLTVYRPSGNVDFSQGSGSIDMDGDPLTNSRVDVTDFEVELSTPSAGMTFLSVTFKIDGMQVGPWEKHLYYSYP